MGSEWPEVALDELYEFGSGLSKPRSAFGSGYPFLSFKDVFDNIFVPNQLSDLVNSTEAERERCSVLEGDVFLTRTSETQEELGMSSVALTSIPNATFNGFTKRLRPRTGTRIDPRYAAYYFRSPGFRRAVTSMSTLSTRASLNNEMLSRLTMLLPPMDEQQRIASILGALDDKIELNHRMSRTLDEAAQTIFSSWFVDPVGSCDDVGLPDRWTWGTLGTLIEQRMERVRPGQESQSRPYVPLECLSPKSLALRESRPGSMATSSLATFRRGDVLFGAYRPYFHKVNVMPFDGTTRTTAFVLKSRRDVDRAFVALQLIQDRTIEYATANSEGTTIPYAKWAGSLEDMRIPIPPASLRSAFGHVVWPMIERQFVLVREVSLLGTVRDSLLPRLLSGGVCED